MIADSIHFRGHRCFKKDWAGFDTIKPINVIIGRNNTGKSHLLDLAEALCTGLLHGKGWQFRCRGKLDETSLRRAFPETHSGGELEGNHWQEHGRHFIGQPMTWEIDANINIVNEVFESEFNLSSPYGGRSTNERLANIRQVLGNVAHSLTGSVFRRLLADRDIKPETPSIVLSLDSDGRGASNIIRRYIVTSNSRYPREIIQRDLLVALNTIFASDGRFTEIQVKVHDEGSPGKPQDHWEVFLGESQKGLIPLSNSGSGLKTVFLVLELVS